MADVTYREPLPIKMHARAITVAYIAKAALSPSRTFGALADGLVKALNARGWHVVRISEDAPQDCILAAVEEEWTP